MTKKIGLGIAAACLGAAIGIWSAPSAVAEAPPAVGNQGTIALPPGGTQVIYPQTQTIGGANPYVPFGTDPLVPYGVWAP